MTDATVALQSQRPERQEMLRVNRLLETWSAEQRIDWALGNLPGSHVVSSSFGVQSAVMLHLMNRMCPGIPVVMIDTGYLFDETYRFVDQLQRRLKLNLEVYRPALSSAWHEARHGKLWLDGKTGIERYNRTHKVEPMQRALKELEAGCWYAGLRREQSQTRKPLTVLRWQQGRYKVHPLVDWSRRDVHRYLRAHDLPYHPLWEQGYQSVGDRHTSRPLRPGMSEEQSRFFGLTRECGLHL
jgi:phosphoadenosine phosphosulfate reductase